MYLSVGKILKEIILDTIIYNTTIHDHGDTYKRSAIEYASPQ